MFLKTNRQFRRRKTPETSEHILDLIGDEVTINKNFVAAPNQLRAYYTLFKEIKIQPYQLVVPVPENHKYTGDKMGYREFIGYLLDNIRQVVRSTWDDSKFHIIDHSSGYDSRILSHIIRQLYNKKIINGDILFICFQPEGDGFKKIMQYEGWPEKNYMVYNEDAVPDEYYAPCFGFENKWLSYNGLSQWPGDILFWVIKDLQAQGKLPMKDESIQSYGMGYFDELNNHKLRYKKRSSVHRFLETYYFNRFPQSMSNFKGDRIMPMLDMEIVKLMLGPDWGWVTKAKIKESLIKKLDPGLYQFKNTYPGSAKNPYHMISERILDKVKADYASSWYGENIRPDMIGQATRVLGYAPWWACYSAASVVEHLRESGVEIRI